VFREHGSEHTWNNIAKLEPHFVADVKAGDKN
jgi:hypothetical protein